jgi:putative oxidoreductase
MSCAVLSIIIAVSVRALLVLLFLPFSALDKLLNFRQAVDQASQAVALPLVAKALIVIGFCIEVVMSTAVVTGLVDRLAALILAVYCILTAMLWKQFWREPDFRLRGSSRGRDTFWDFLKNLAVAAGFLLITFGSDTSGVRRFFDRPLDSSHPYTIVAPEASRS